LQSHVFRVDLKGFT